MSQQQKNILTIGHRGAMGHETENSMASIIKALSLGCDMIEIDVFKIKTGELVLYHDHNMMRLSGIDKNIESLSLEELSKYAVKGNHPIATLTQVIEAIDQRAILNIELKGDDTALQTYALVQQYINKGYAKHLFIVSSFDWHQLSQIYELDPTFPLAVLTQANIQEAIDFAQKIQAVAINPYYKDLTKTNTQCIKSHGFKIYPWTVNTPVDIQTMKELGVDGIITNFPERI